LAFYGGVHRVARFEVDKTDRMRVVGSDRVVRHEQQRDTRVGELGRQASHFTRSDW
jgi:hypothetical protein